MNAIEKGQLEMSDKVLMEAELYGPLWGELSDAIIERTANARAAEVLEKMAGEFMSEAIIEGLKVEGMATEDHDWPDAFATWSTLKHAKTKLDNRIKELRGKEND